MFSNSVVSKIKTSLREGKDKDKGEDEDHPRTGHEDPEGD